MKQFATLILLCFIIQLNAQITVEGRVIDENTHEGIPYVNIGIIELSTGTVSNDDGSFKLKADSNDDVIVFSSIGYATRQVSVKDLKNMDLVEMLSQDYNLDVVEIKAFRYEEEEVRLGSKNKERGHSIAFGSAQLGAEIGAGIEIERPTYIKSANFVLNHAKGDSLLFRVNIYDLSTGEVGQNLLSENILIKEKQRKGVITVQLDKYDIMLDSDVLLTLEWLRNFDEIGNKGVTFDTKKSKKMGGVYAKHVSNGPFIKLGKVQKVRPCFYFIGKQVKQN